MTSFIFIAVFAAAALILFLLCAILKSLFEIERLLVRMLEGERDAEKPIRGAFTDDEEGRALEQRRWEEGVANLLSYMGSMKGGEKL
jgi:hypothetical protein